MNRRAFLEGAGLLAAGLVLGAGCLPRGDHDGDTDDGIAPAALEADAIALYDDLLAADSLRTSALRERLELFRDHHRAHLRALGGTSDAGGGEPGRRLRRAVGPDLDDERGVAVAALELESILAATYVAHVTEKRPGSSTTLVGIAGIEARHATALRHHLRRDPLLAPGLYPVTGALPR